MHISMNRRMSELLSSENIDFEQDLPLTVKGLLDLLEAGIHQHGDIYSISSREPTHEDIKRAFDETGYEASENHIHMEDYVGRGGNPIELVKVGLAYSQKIAEILKKQFPTIPFQISLSYHTGKYPSCVVRFHKQRPDEHWLTEDLEGYKEEAVLAIDITPV